MRKALVGVLALLGAMGVGLAGLAMGNGALSVGEAAMMVSPQTIVTAKVASVTVHTNISADEVASGTVALEGVSALSVWADDCGHLAARFAVADLGLAAGEATLTLTGDYVAGGGFSATDEVRVK